MQVSRMIGCYIKAGGSWTVAAESARAQGLLRKDTVGGSSHGDLTDELPSLTGAAFLSYLQEGPSAFDRLRAFTRPAAFNTPLLTPASPLSAALIAEGGPAPVTKLSNSSSALTPAKVGAIAVASKEALNTVEGQEAFSVELRNAIGVATDFELLTRLAEEGDSDAATASPLEDIKVLLDTVNTSGFGSLFFIAAPSTANLIATLEGDKGRLFPDATPTGGTICGVPVLVTAGAPIDTLTLLDASSLSTGSEDVKIELSDRAPVMMQGEDVSSDEGAPPIISTFQADAVALLGIRSFAAKLVRPTGAAVLSGVSAAWAQEG